MSEARVKLSVELTVNDKVTMEMFNKPADKTTIGELRELLAKTLEQAPFKVNISF